VDLRVKREPMSHNGDVVERWTQERRRQHTRDVLLDAAEDVFARRGFEGAALEEIAEAAGYTRGAIYKNFGSKEELFLAVNHRFNERFLSTFAITPGTDYSSMDLSAIARHWREMWQFEDPQRFALGLEFQLYLLRNPEARARAAEQRHRLVEMVAAFWEDQAAQLGLRFRVSFLTLARLVLATGDGLHLAEHLDESEDDLYLPFLEALMSLQADRETPRETRVNRGQVQVRSPRVDKPSTAGTSRRPQRARGR
jgi:AcrR family transcriptional regulator